jgi:hypothetical protein
MASFIDIFNPSFFMFLGIVVLVAALLIVYFESKMREQNHKISSMFSLVTAITDELNSVKMIALSGGGGTRPNYIPDDGPKLEESIPVIEIRNDESITLIEVSDDDTDDEDEEDEEDDEDSGSSDSESESDEVKEPPEIIEIGDLKSSDIKILNVNMMSSNSQSFWAAAASEIIECDFEDAADEIDADSFSSESSSESGDDFDAILVMEEIMVIKEEPKVEEQEEPKVEEQTELEPPEPEIIDLTEDNEDEPDAIIASPEIKIEPGTLTQLDLELKTIHISNLEEPTPFDSAVIDYTKASLNKLRQIVVVKGLVEDSSKSSKLKKGELLKLLGVSE